MLDFSFDENTREFSTKQNYEVGIHTNNIITKVEYSEQYDAIDIQFENPRLGYSYRHREFNPVRESYPFDTTPQKEISKFQAKVKHILKRFLPEDEIRFKANTFKEMALAVIDLLQTSAVDTGKEFSLKLIYNKALTYPELPRAGRFMAIEGEKELAYTNWELENRMIDVDATVDTNDEEVPATTSDDQVF